MRTHRVASAAMDDLGHSSKLNVEWPFLVFLRAAGRRAARLFLDAHRTDLGRRSSPDLDVVLPQAC